MIGGLGHDWMGYEPDPDNAQCVLCQAWWDEPEAREPCPVTEPPADGHR